MDYAAARQHMVDSQVRTNKVTDERLIADGGRLVGVLLDQGVGRASLWIKSGNTVSRRVLFDANVALLPGFATPPRFVF